MNITKNFALITGGASGIGLGVANELLSKNIKGICIVDINPRGIEIAQELNRKFGENKVLFCKSDVSDKSSLRSAFQNTINFFGNLDLVFNNAGTVNEFDSDKCYKVNVLGATNCIKLAMEEFLPKYKSGAEGIIINTVSIVALEPSYWTVFPVYVASKCALLGLTQNLSQEYHFKKSGVKIIAICPGVTETPILNLEGVVEVTEEFSRLMEPYGSQKVEDLVQYILPILEQSKNGSVWKLDGGKMEEVVFPKIK